MPIASGRPDSRMSIEPCSFDAASTSQARLKDAYFGGLMEPFVRDNKAWEKLFCARSQFFSCPLDAENLERRHLGRRHWGIGIDGRIWNLCKNVQCKGSVNAHVMWKYHIPNRKWNNQVLRTSTLIWYNPDRGGEQEHLLGKLDGSPPQHQDSSWHDGEAGNDFWSISGNFIYRHHVEPRVKLYVPREESFLTPLKFFDVTRTTDTSSDVTRFTFWNEEPLDGYTGGDWQEYKRLPGQTLCGQRFGTVGPMHRNAKKRKKWAIEKPKLDNARRLRGIYFTDPDDEEFNQAYHEKCS